MKGIHPGGRYVLPSGERVLAAIHLLPDESEQTDRDHLYVVTCDGDELPRRRYASSESRTRRLFGLAGVTESMAQECVGSHAGQRAVARSWPRRAERQEPTSSAPT